MTTNDPTHAEMVRAMEGSLYLEDADPIDIECAIYWYAANYHGGQTSTLYRVLSTSDYRPGAAENAPEGLAFDLYDLLVEAFA